MKVEFSLSKIKCILLSLPCFIIFTMMNIIFIPKCNMSEAEIWFICRQINIYWTYHNKLPPTVVCLKNKLFYDHIEDYVWELFPISS